MHGVFLCVPSMLKKTGGYNLNMAIPSEPLEVYLAVNFRPRGISQGVGYPLL